MFRQIESTTVTPSTMLASPPHSAPALPSNTRFGWLFSAIFLGAAVYTHLGTSPVLAGALLGLSVLTACLTLMAPRLLLPFNRLWFAFGILLGRIVQPLVLGAIFFLILTPTSLLGRAFGRDALSIRRRQVDSYWLGREPPGPAPESFRNQF